MATDSPIRLGTRASALARWQADWVSARLGERGVEVVQVPITTAGDRHQVGKIEQIGGQGVFTKELQRALLDGQIDLAVHSLKDLPTEEVDGLALAAVPPRGPVGDVLVSRQGYRFLDLPEASVLGTGSLRRRSQLLNKRPDLRMEDIRGNVDTRLRKLAEQQYDAIVLAQAGIERLGLAEHITQVLPTSMILPAPGQGALGLETRADDHIAQELLAPLDDRSTHQAITAERTMLATLRGGCLAPVGAWGRFEMDDELHLSGVVLSLDGSQRLEFSLAGDPNNAEGLGREVAEALIAQGAMRLIQSARGIG